MLNILSQESQVAEARAFLTALGPDVRWRLIRADGPEGYWSERKDDPGQPPDRLPLDRMDAIHNWHVRPMPLTGPFVLTMLDDTTPAALDRMTSDGLSPTAVVATSPGRYEIWHRWPWAMPKAKAGQLIRHLQQIYHTDPGANAPGRPGRLSGSCNRKPGRNGCPVRLVSTGAALTDTQARTWLRRFPVPTEPQVRLIIGIDLIWRKMIYEQSNRWLSLSLCRQSDSLRA
ncbi:protein of unknown function [Candidatus Hydrogenisulfobacillus filiaventi]|uniref:RepB-like DNA primase domain-containing protein n=1 Tax=Candidatus Hydrogenisulfobacillus filiaventi TaxID=2707344 RepID=A0A6F8ZEN1_9FIRM|nr:protein of unknown function [Candidatus Hydrogenisulfobacillus filiaventi]